MTDKSNLYVVVSSFFPHNVAVSLGIMGQLFGNNGYLLAESENSIMGIKLGIIVSALLLCLYQRCQGPKKFTSDYNVN